VNKIDEHEELIYQTVESVLKKHNFEEECYRLQEGRYIGVGTHRILIRLCLEYLDGSWSKTICFYHKCRRKKDQPHYEDLTTTLLVAFAGTFLANVLTELSIVSVRKLKNYLAKKKIEREAIKLVFSEPVHYVLLGTALRDRDRSSKNQPDWDALLNSKVYTALLKSLDQQLGQVPKPPFERGRVHDKTVERYHQYCKQYFLQHRFVSEDPTDELLEEIIDDLSNKLEKLLREDLKKDDIT
jgi:hypothetical protein